MTTDLALVHLREAEAVIRAGLATFVEVGNALMRIRDERLYVEDYATFEAYCRGRWGFSDRRARQMIDAAEITATLLRLGEAAEILGVHPGTVRRWADQGKVPFVRTPGGERRFRREDLALVYGEVDR